MDGMRLAPVLMGILLVTAACGAGNPGEVETSVRILADVPEVIDPDGRYLIYLHGAIIERAGVRPTHPKFGVYEYQKVLEAFAERGFLVISEARPDGTDGMLYAATVADQVGALMNGGVSPEHITVVGFSKGEESLLRLHQCWQTTMSTSYSWPPAIRGSTPTGDCWSGPPAVTA